MSKEDSGGIEHDPARLRGVVAAVLTPVDKEYRPDLERMLAHCQSLLAAGCDALGILGTTGEAASQSLDDRVGVIQGLADHGVPGSKLLPGTGAGNLGDTVLLTRAAVEAGARNVLVVPPYYYKGVSDEGLFAFYSEVIERVGDSRLRLYLYHIPQNTGVPISRGLIARLLQRYPQVTAGIKDSSGDWNNMSGLAGEFPGFGVFAGTEQYLLKILQAGGVGCISASVNLTAPLAASVFRAWSEGRTEAAERMQHVLTDCRKALQAYSFMAGQKAILAERLQDPDWSRVLPPLAPLEASQQSTLLALWADLERRLHAAA